MPIIDDPGDVYLSADSQGDGSGSIVFATGGVERARISAGGDGTGIFRVPQELGFAEITTQQTTTSGTYVDISGLALTGITVVDKPLEFVFTAPQGVESTADGDMVVISLLRGSTVVRSQILVVGTTANRSLLGASCHFRDHPAPGTYTYKLQWFRFSGTGTIKLNATGSPYFTYPSLSCRELAAAL